MRAYEFLNESILMELATSDITYKGHTIKYTPNEVTLNGKTGFFATGIDSKGGMVGGNQPHHADTAEEAVQIVKGMIDQGYEVQRGAFSANRVTNKVAHALNFNTKFTDQMMNNLENTWIKIINYNGDAAIEMAPLEEVDSFSPAELKAEGYRLLQDRKGFGTIGRAFGQSISAARMNELELDSGGRYLLELVPNNEDRLIYSMDQTGGLVSDKTDKVDLPGPGVTIIRSTKGGQ